MVGIRGAAVVVTAVAVTVTLLSGCELVATGGQGAGPSEPGTSTTAPAAKPTTTTATPKPSATPSVTPKPEPTPTKTRPTALLAPGDKGEKVRELQHRLCQLERYAGSITGTYARDDQGVKGFQGKRKFAVTGEVDQRTWSKLVAMTHRPTRAERHNILVAGAGADEVRFERGWPSAACRPG